MCYVLAELGAALGLRTLSSGQIYSLSKFQAHTRISLTVVAMLHIGSSNSFALHN